MSVPGTLGVPLAALPETRAATQPDAAAIADEAVALGNAAFADRVARAPALLARLGVGPGDADPAALALLIYTSGTTGKPALRALATA